MVGVGADDALSFACAALAAGGNATANVMQRKASLEQSPEQRFGPRLLLDLIGRSTWRLGFAAMVGSFVFQALALALGQLSAVETIITLEVPLTLLFASWAFRVRVGRAEWSGIWVMTVGMIGLVAVLDPRPGREGDVGHGLYAAAGGGTIAGIALLLLAARRGHRLWRTGCLGAAAGASFGLTATLIKETMARLDSDGVLGMLTAWQTYAAIGTGLLGVTLMQAALHSGPLLAAQPGVTLADPAVSVLWGVLVYDEAVRSGWWLLPAVAAAAAIVAGVVLLARSPLLSAVNENALEAPGTPHRDGPDGAPGTPRIAPAH